MPSKYLLCVHCKPVATQQENMQQLNQHILSKHPNLSVFLCYCRKSYTHKNSLMRHIQEKHLNAPGGDAVLVEQLVPSSSPSSSVPSSSATNEGVEEETPDLLPIPEEAIPAPIDTSGVSEFDLQSEAGVFLMNLRSSGNITGATVQIVQDCVFKLMKGVVTNLSEKTSTFLRNSGIGAEDTAKFISDVFSLDNPFKDLETTQKQIDYFSKNFALVKPEEKLLDYRIENRLDRTTKLYMPTHVNETFQYVSLLQTLKKVVCNKYIRDLILAEKGSTDGIYRSYKDGLDFKRNLFLRKYPDTLRIMLWYDDLETSSALGSKDVIHKLGCFFFTIQNLPPEESSQLASIHALALTYAEDLKKPGAFSKVLTPMFEDLKMLQTDEGVKVDLPEGGSYTLRAKLVSLSADSLAAHSIMGFMSPSATLFCRRCMITKEDMKKDSVHIGQLRTSDLHKKHVKQVEKDPALSSKFGVKEGTLLQKYMRIPEDNVMDLFHDLVGVIQMIIKLALHEYVCVKKLFTVSEFNSRIHMFCYGIPDRRNKPSPNFTKERLMGAGHSLKQRGAQTFCLLRIFPFIISGVEENDQCLELVFLLQDIFKILSSFEISETSLLRLENLIYRHNSLFHELFVTPAPQAAPDASNDDSEGDGDDDGDDDDGEDSDGEACQAVGQRRTRKTVQSRKLKKGINKLHHLVHYPEEIRHKGPVIRLWCARFEGRILIIRRHSHVQCNFKNVPKTMMQMFQLSTLAAFENKTGPPRDVVSYTGSVPISVENCAYFEALVSKGLLITDQVLVSKSAEIRGEEYMAGLYVALKNDGVITIGQPLFGLIVDVVAEVAENRRIFLVVQKCLNEGLSAMYNSYKVCPLLNTVPVLSEIKDLAHYQPIAPWSPAQQNVTSAYLHPRTVFV